MDRAADVIPLPSRRDSPRDDAAAQAEEHATDCEWCGRWILPAAEPFSDADVCRGGGLAERGTIAWWNVLDVKSGERVSAGPCCALGLATLVVTDAIDHNRGRTTEVREALYVLTVFAEREQRAALEARR